MPTHLDWSTLTAAGLYLMLTSLFCCPESTAHCPSVSPFANCFLWVPSSHFLTGVPLPTSSRVEISSSGLCLVSRQNRQRDRLLCGPPTSCHILNSSVNSVLSNTAFAYSCYVIKTFKTHFKKTTPYTCKQPLMMAYERSESAPENFGKFINQFQPETKTLIRKLERILIKLYRQNLSLLFNETHTHYIYIYIYIYTHTHTKNIYQ